MKHMNKRLLIRLGIMAIAALVAYFGKDKVLNDGGSNRGPNPSVVQDSPKLKANLKFDSANSKNLVMQNMAIKDMDGSVAYRGNVDLAPTLARIKAGKRDKHKNDGSTFGNFEGLLPKKQRGYYKEFVVRTPNINHAGPQRLVIGQNGEIYYTHNHYKSFKRINP